MRTDDELRAAIAGQSWYHSIELRPGIVTPGKSQEKFVLSMLGIPGDLTGKTVLDIGCYDGFFSFECEKRGASRVVACDTWELAGRGAFDLARDELGSGAVPLEASVYDLPGKLGGEQFDLVLFLGVLYHLRHPLLALEKVAACAAPGSLTIVDSVVDDRSLFTDRPLMAFFPGDELNGDPTNWWAPNHAALCLMTGAAGFDRAVSRVQLHGGNRSIVHALKATG